MYRLTARLTARLCWRRRTIRFTHETSPSEARQVPLRMRVRSQTTSSPTSHSSSFCGSPSSISQKRPYLDHVHGTRRFQEFELEGRVFVVTGGARGLGLTLAEAVAESGGHVHCLDRSPEPTSEFRHLQNHFAQHYGGSLHYRQIDVQHASDIDGAVEEIAAKHGRLDGLIAAAGIQNVTPALEYPPEKISELMNINFGGVYLSAVACARQMLKHGTPGSIILVASMSGLIANKGIPCSMYNSSKGAVIQLGRSLAMEWGKIVSSKPIRVNVLCPGNIMTPMLRENIEGDPQLRELLEKENMLGRISEPHEYRGAALFLLSEASSFMTGSHLVIDGGYTAW